MVLIPDERALHQRFEQLDRERSAQHQDRQPGVRGPLEPKPDCGEEIYVGSGKLTDKVAIITGGDSGIGRAAAIAFAREGADVIISYLDERTDAQDTAGWIQQAGRRCILLEGDVGRQETCRALVDAAAREFGRLDIVVNNAAIQHRVETPEEITEEQIVETFRTNIFSHFFLTIAALDHLGEWSTIINTTSIVAYEGNDKLIAYSATKGAIVTFTRSMAKALIPRKIRVNAVAPGPVWTPLIAATFPENEVEEFGRKYPIGRAAQPVEIAPSFVFLASADSSAMTGQVLHPNGGVIVSG